jgi:hypothetical protein
MNGHHPDYDALLHHPQHALTHGAAGGHPAPAAAGHAMVPVHEVHSLLHGINSQMAQIREHQQRQPQHAPPPAYAPPPSHHDPRDTRAREEHERHERARHDHRQGHHNEHDYRRGPRQRPPASPLKIREFPVGFVQAAVPAGALAEIEVKPQVRFQGHRLAVAASQARYFNIVDIKVGKDSQLAATGEMPAEAFSSLAVGTQMELDCAPPGIVITLIVRNTDTASQDFGAVLYGEVEEGGEDR